MKKLVYLFVMSIGLLISCDKDSRILQVAPKPDPIPEGKMISATELLRGVKVAGSEKITFDSLHNAYMVSFPPTYNAQLAEVTLSLKPGVQVRYDTNEPTPDSTISYKFQRTSPLSFQLEDKADNDFSFLSIYFNFSGTPKIELLQKEIAVNAAGIKLPFRFDVKEGSSPASYDFRGPFIKITNTKTGLTEEASLYTEDPRVYLANAAALATNEPLSIEFTFFNQNPVVFEGIRFTRATPIVGDLSYYPFQYARPDTIKASGGFFLPTQKYTVAFSNASMPVPATFPVRVNDNQSLMLDKIPANLPDGSYLLSYFENDKLLGKASLELAKKDTKSLESIWKGDLSNSTDRNVEQLSVSRGDEFYVKPTPLMFTTPRVTFDADHLPRLRLKSAEKTIILVPQVAIYSWAMAGVSFALGKYTVPADLPSGEYMITGIYPDKTETKPYWSSLKVK
ncbi:hypothetical protein L0663_18420 [Dyadobacter sp. CY107]|uniref:hypothetical protein n=1 Tax=Dyadobacter fanqingshengii TaxID=2906443 RepID=UPI001F29DB78|nr:hypothetical protein [Dyadobacter fanqingshengii]MCF2505373.1 hypothetical protein [Dyadobacter fanqingshengii]